MVQIFPPLDPALETKMAHCDLSLAATIERALADCSDLDATNVSVTILGRFVVLEGKVEDPCDADRVVAIAEDVAGKPYVRNRLLVRWSGRLPGEGWHRY